MTSCNYALKSDPAKTVDAEYLGYWSVKWSSDLASAALQAFQQPPLAELPIIREAMRQPFHLSLVLIALHSAVYWALSAGVPALGRRIDRAIYDETMNGLRRGRDASLSDLVTPSGAPLPADTRQQVVALFERFYEDVLRDLCEPAPADPEIDSNRISRAAARFVAVLQANFKMDFPHNQQIVFGGFIDRAMDRLAGHLQQDLDVRV